MVLPSMLVAASRHAAQAARRVLVRPVVAGLLLATVGLAGCHGVLSYEEEHRNSAYPLCRASWRDPALWHVVDAPELPAEGMAWNTDGLSHPFNASAIRMIRIPTGDDHVTITLGFGRVMVRVDGDRDATPAIEIAVDAMRRLGVDQQAKLDVLRQELLENREHEGHTTYKHEGRRITEATYLHEAAAPGGLDLRAAWDAGNGSMDPWSPIMRNGWQFHVWFASKELSVENGTLLVDARGGAVLLTDPSAGYFDEAAALADVLRRLQLAALPAPPEGINVSPCQPIP